MRHGKKFNHLGRKKAHREAMLSNMAISLIMHKKIQTTVAKAKALKVFVEPLLTKSRVDSTHSRRVVFSYLQNKFAVSELFREISPKIADRPGGYTRILKTGNRLGDNAEMCIIELVDYNDNMLKDKKTKAKSTRRRRGGAKKTEEGVAVEKTTPKVEKEEVAEDSIVEETVDVKEETKEVETVAEVEEEKVEEVKDELVEDKVEEVKEEVVEEKTEEAIEEVDAKVEEVKAEEEKKEDEKPAEPKEEK